MEVHEIMQKVRERVPLKNEDMLEYLLDEAVFQHRYCTAAIAVGDKIIARSETKDALVNLAYLVKLGQRVLNCVKNGVKDAPNELVITGEFRKIYLKRFSMKGDLNYLLIVAFSPNTLYYKRKLNKLVKVIREIARIV